MRVRNQQIQIRKPGAIAIKPEGISSGNLTLYFNE